MTGRIRWDESFAMELGHVDDDHRVLFEFVGQLQAALDAGHEIDDSRVLERLFAYAREHFAHEEALMAQYGFPGAEEHQEEHRAFFRRVVTFSAECERSRQVACSRLVNFLGVWLVRHMQLSDRRFADWMLQRHGLRIHADPGESGSATAP